VTGKATGARAPGPEYEEELSEIIQRAASVVRARAGSEPIARAIVLGSGLADSAALVEQPTRILFAELPGFATASVAGHPGVVLFGRIGKWRVCVFVGRAHAYEGHSAGRVLMPVRLLHALGVPVLLLSNAAGGIAPDLAAGDLMLIRDHIDLSFRTPLRGPPLPGAPRFPDMSQPYDRTLSDALRAAALRAGVAVKEGVYAAVCGPSYETPAEIRMLRRIGADAVGMSTVPEAIAGHALGIRIAAVSVIANRAAGLGGPRLSHEDVLSEVRAAGTRFAKLISAWCEEST
jgi:purine-nucleoside phosphorylase